MIDKELMRVADLCERDENDRFGHESGLAEAVNVELVLGILERDHGLLNNSLVDSNQGSLKTSLNESVFESNPWGTHLDLNAVGEELFELLVGFDDERVETSQVGGFFAETWKNAHVEI